MNRVLLINKTKGPSRAELVSSERRTGELLFARFPDLRFAGYIGATGTGKLAANWIIPQGSFDSFREFAETVECDGYELAVYTDGKSVIGGGQSEVRVI